MIQTELVGYRLSPQQKRLFSLLSKGDDYRAQALIEIEGTIDVSQLERALRSVVDRHEALRTDFRRLPGMKLPVQIIQRESMLRLTFEDLANSEPSMRESLIEKWFRRPGGEPAGAGENRIGFVTLGPDHGYLLVDLAAMNADARSLKNFVDDLKQSYLGKEPAEAPIPYVQYSEWQLDLLEGSENEYWRENGRRNAAHIKLDIENRAMAPKSRSGVALHSQPIPARLTNALDEIDGCGERSNVLLAGWVLLLSRLTREPETTVVVQSDGRVYDEMNSLIGVYEKWLPIHCRIEDAYRLDEVRRQVADRLDAAREWQEYYASPASPNHGDREQASAEDPIGYDFHQLPEDEPAGAVCFTIRRLECFTEKFKLRLSVTSRGDEVIANFYFDAAIYRREDIEILAERYVGLLDQLAKNRTSRVSRLELVAPTERRRLLEWSGRREAPQISETIHRLFERQAERTPDRAAVRYEQKLLSYGELNRRANQLAHFLRSSGATIETRVGLCLERSENLPVAVLGVLKAGAAYAPFDPGQPAARLDSMIRRAGVEFLITDQRFEAASFEQATSVLRLDALLARLQSYPTENLSLEVDGRNLAYIVFTSGSTGSPKGAMVTHRSVVNLAQALNASIDESGVAPRRVSLNAPLAFDSSVKQWIQLLFGHEIIVVPEQVRRDGPEMMRLLDREKIEILDCTPSQFKLLLDAGLAEGAAGSLRKILLGGESIDEPMWSRLAADEGERVYYNVYGPTECTVDATCQRIDGSMSPTIGRPIENVETYILDEAQRLAPLGAAGELCIGGAGVGRGYAGEPAMTAEKFIPHPDSLRAGERIYRTGDLARYGEEGRIEFLGRIDQQIKIRGSRIEPGEIEALLLKAESVRECVVVAAEDETGDQRLVAYVTPRAGAAIRSADLRRFLQPLLPEYMIPNFFLTLESLPLNRNGKVNRAALPPPGSFRRTPDKERALPRTSTEESLSVIWEELLRLDQLGVDDNFFELGGHSLLATQVVAQIRKTLQVELPLRSLFERPTIAELGAYIDQLSRESVGMALPTVEKARRDQPLPLSFAQQRLWFLQQLDPESVAYNIPCAFRLSGELDREALAQALTEVLRRHEVLRTVFREEQGRPAQHVPPAEAYNLVSLDLSGLSNESQSQALQGLMRDEARAPFDLKTGPLLRAQLVRLASQEHALLLTMHHIVFDAWSIGILTREVSVLYEAYRGNRQSPLAEPPIQYADYANWQRQWLRGEVLDQQLAYWTNRLRDLPALGLPTDRPHPPVPTFKGARLTEALPAGLSAELRALSRRHGTTLFMTLLALFKVLLYRHTGQRDISVGVPIANRRIKEVEHLIGFFLNTLVLRTELSRGMSFPELLTHVREVALEAYAHQDLPFELLVERLQPDRDMSRAPLFQVMFGMKNAGREVSLAVEGLRIESIETDGGSARMDLIFLMDDSGGELSAWVEYNADVFNAETIERLLQRWRMLLESVVARPEETLDRLDLLTAGERRRLLSDWNATFAPRSEEKTIQRLFDEQAARTPDAEAVIFEDQRLTYDALNRRANQLARRLRRSGVGPETLVGICLDRSIDMATAVLGVLKAGAAYVPIDPTYPGERRAYLMEDSRISVLLTQDPLFNPQETQPLETIFVDRDWEQIAQESDATLEERACVDNLVYVTYTSGSTGRPKGIAMPQRPLLNLLQWQLQTTTLPPGARTLQFASLSFDVSFQDLFSTWLAGGAVVMISSAVRREMASLAGVLREARINRLFIPAVALQQLADQFPNHAPAPLSLRRVIAGSEQLQITHGIDGLFRRLPSCEMHNEYGPSETHVVTALEMPSDRNQWAERPLIGKPIHNVRIYIMNEAMQPAPIGCPGELCIGGVCSARGYLHRPDLTAERFIPDLFGEQPGGRLYCTGDLARWRSDGNLEFLGRADFQVKLRGYRIELGEIEVALGQHPAVRENVALVREDVPGDKRLVSYFVSAPDASPGADRLRAFLRDKLPEFMVPSHFVRLEALPMNGNGKVDRRSLPVPDGLRPEMEERYVAPGDALEELLARLWADVLGVEQPGVNDNFFELGGHSLLATQLISRVRGAFEIELPLRRFFEAPTIAGLAGKLKEVEGQLGELEANAQLLLQLDRMTEADAERLLLSETQLEQIRSVHRGNQEL